MCQFMTLPSFTFVSFNVCFFLIFYVFILLLYYTSLVVMVRAH